MELMKSADGTRIAVDRSGTATRLQVRLHRSNLDHRLADGHAPEDSAALGLRAAQLATETHRRSLASSLRLVVDKATRPPGGLGSMVPIDREAVGAWREAISGLADRLERPGPVDPRGVARVAVLLSDGAGPLYNSASERSLGEAIWWIADGMQPVVVSGSAIEPASPSPPSI
jgi:hypothetical protein